MDSNTNNPPRKISLPVLVSSNKVEQLKEEAAAAAPAGPSPDYVPHVNRTRPGAAASPEQKALEERVIKAIRMVYDPEIPINIYDLGLIYDIEIDSEQNVYIRMTLTAPGCPVAGSLPLAVEMRVQEVPGVKSAQVEIVWDPPWNRDMMSEAARLELGM